MATLLHQQGSSPPFTSPFIFVTHFKVGGWQPALGLLHVRSLNSSAGSAVNPLNPKAEVAQAQAAWPGGCRTFWGPKSTMKMLVHSAGDIRLTEDSNMLLHEMQIQYPTASLIAKVAAAQDYIW